MDFQDDLIVIGAGSGGVRASRIAASLGAKVSVIEQSCRTGRQALALRRAWWTASWPR